MAIFDELVQRANRTKEDLLQKTQDLSEINRLTRSLSEAENAGKQILQKIGEHYVKIHAADYEPSFADFIRAFNEKTAEAENLRQQIRDIKGIRVCKSCGADVPKEAAFCQSCGKAIPKEDTAVPAGFVKCSRCRALVPDDMMFCTSCGRALEKTQVKPCCSNCGTVLKEGAMFCSVCGTPVKQTPTPVPKEEPVSVPTEEPVIAPEVEAETTQDAE